MEILSLNNNVELRNELKKIGEKNHISDDEVICSIVYEFASKLPYSMDYMDKDFVPGIFINISPAEPGKPIFRDFDSLYHKMISWGDTKKSGILLQICNIFQAMLMGQISSDYELNEEDFYNLGIDQMTSNNEYNKYLFETLKMLPKYCTKLNNTQTIEERRRILNDIYSVILDRVGQKIGGFRKTSIDGGVVSVQEHKATISLSPRRDLDMLYCFEGISHGFNVRSIVDNINEKMLLKINQTNQNKYLDSECEVKELKKKQAMN